MLNEASAYLIGDFDRHVARPALGGVKGDDAHRVLILTLKYVADQGRPARTRLISLTPRPTERAEVVQYN